MGNPEALKRAAWLAAAYPGRSVDEAHIASWAEELESLTTHEIEDVIAMLRLRAVDPPSVAQVRDCIAEIRRETMSPALAMTGHAYVDGAECPICLVVHGAALEPSETVHGLRHLADGEREKAEYPAECDCGFSAPVNVNVEAVIEIVAKGLVFSMKDAFESQ